VTEAEPASTALISVQMIREFPPTFIEEYVL
jgi:hypothetical protein